MSETNERSVASTGSVEWTRAEDQGLPNVTRNDDGSVSLVWPTDKQTVVSVSRELMEHIVGSLNDSRAHILTDAERQAIKGAISCCEDITYGGAANQEAADVLKALLERTK